MRTRTRTISAWSVFALSAGAIVAVSITGCSMKMPHDYMDEKPGLGDVRVLGPKGQKCYDFCATSHANCDEMCPRTSNHEDYDCADDCLSDSKVCLEDCPELQRPLPRTPKK
ncbi:MAG TPA: hypothetical protein VN634_06925 [Candidatus Limnocylindrales bacterium]|nr:hypothetical protein [Candidatus Limnocylindrales bacterium]